MHPVIALGDINFIGIEVIQGIKKKIKAIKKLIADVSGLGVFFGSRRGIKKKNRVIDISGLRDLGVFFGTRRGIKKKKTGLLISAGY